MADALTPQAKPTRSALSVDLKFRWPSRYLVSWVALVIVAILAAVIAPATYHGASINLITALAGILLLASLGELLIVMVGAIDLSVPGFITLSAAINVHYVGSIGAVPALLFSLAVCCAVSAVSGALIAYLRVNALIVTFAMNTIILAGLLLWMGQTFSVSGQAPHWTQSLAHKSWLHVNAIFLVALVFAAVISGLVYHTRAGRPVPTIGANRTAARFLGIRVNPVFTLTFAGAGLLYAVAGALAAGFVQVPDATLGTSYQLATVTAVAIAGAVFAGGPASASSLVASCLLLQVLAQALALKSLNPGVDLLIQGILLVLAVASGTLAHFGGAGFARIRKSFGSIRSTP